MVPATAATATATGRRDLAVMGTDAMDATRDRVTAVVSTNANSH
jgi:hypothetical protein